MATDTNPAQRALFFLTGEIHALFMFSQALAKSHPDPERLRAELEIAAQHGLAKIEPLPVSDAAIEGYQYIMAGLQKAVATAAASQPYSRDPG